MNLTALSARYWQATLILLVFVGIMGVAAFLTIPRSVDPHYPSSVAIVTIPLTGAGAADVEETVTKPIEIALQGLDNIWRISSSSIDGIAVITIEFTHGTDGERSLDRVVREVQSIRDRLPQGVGPTSYRLARITDTSIVQFALTSDDASWRRMVKYARDLRDQLYIVHGVRQVEIDGAAQPEVRVAIDAGRLAELRLPASAVAHALRQGGIDLPSGTVTTGPRRLNIEAGGAYRSLEAVRQVPLRGGDGQLLHVGDVATVSWAEAEQLHIARYNGKRALWISVKQKDNFDTRSLRNALVQEVKNYRGNLPPDIAVSLAFDQSQEIDEKLSVLARDFVFALGLVLITLLPLGLRPSLIVMLSIPLSLALGVLTLALLGFTLNQISISGFILSLGILVDDSIVVTENIERHIRNGEAATEAAISATREIGAAVVGATGVLVFAFLPLAFLPDAAGDFVRGLPLAVILTVTASLLVSLTVIPFLASVILKPEHAHGNRFLVVVASCIERFYRPVLHHALDHPKRWFWGAMTLCVASFGLVPVLGFSLFPAADAPYFLVRVEAPEGSSIEATDQAVIAVAAAVAKEPLVLNIMENVGRGNPQVYYNLIPREGGTRYGELFVTLKDWPRGGGPALLRRLRERLKSFPDARVTIVRMENGPPLEAPIAVRISGPDIAVLKHLSDRVARIMKDVPGIRDVDNPIAFDRIDLDLGIDEERAGLLGIEPGEIRRAVRLAISGEQASSFRDAEGDSWPVTVRLPFVHSQPVAALSQVYVARPDGESVPLSDITNPLLKSTPAQITRLKLKRTVTVIGYNEPGKLTSTLNAETQARLAKIALPSGYALTAGGEAENAQRSFSGLGPIALLAAFGIFGVLVLEFGRFRETVVVIGSVVPLGTFGGLVALFVTGNSLSFLAIIGFVALVGIEIKNSILLVDFTMRLTKSGMPMREAIEKAGEIRFLPILLTSVTASVGLLPLALSGSSLYAPLAWVIIGGIVSSTLLSRIITPVTYLLATRAQ